MGTPAFTAWHWQQCEMLRSRVPVLFYFYGGLLLDEAALATAVYFVYTVFIHSMGSFYIEIMHLIYGSVPGKGKTSEVTSGWKTGGRSASRE